jgi:hypothetical protein
MLQSITALLASLKDISPLALAIAGLIALGYLNLGVIDKNTVAITKVVALSDQLLAEEVQVMRRLELIERLVSRNK